MKWAWAACVPKWKMLHSQSECLGTWPSRATAYFTHFPLKDKKTPKKSLNIESETVLFCVVFRLLSLEPETLLRTFWVRVSRLAEISGLHIFVSRTEIWKFLNWYYWIIFLGGKTCWSPTSFFQSPIQVYWIVLNTNINHKGPQRTGNEYAEERIT